MATVNCLVTNLFQNIFCAQQKKETHAALEQLGVSKGWQNYPFWVNYAFKYELWENSGNITTHT